MWNIQANIYLDEKAKQKDPVIGDLLEKVMNKCVQFMYYMYHQLFQCQLYALLVHYITWMAEDCNCLTNNSTYLHAFNTWCVHI